MNKKIVSIRIRIGEINERLSLLEPLYITREKAIARIDSYIEHAESSLSIELGGLFLRERQRTRVFKYGETHSFEDKTAGVDCGPILATFLGEEFRAWLIRKVDERVQGNWGLDDEEIETQKTKLLTELYDLECKEESEITKLENEGHEVTRRSDIRYPLVTVLKNPENYADVLL